MYVLELYPLDDDGTAEVTEYIKEINENFRPSFDPLVSFTKNKSEALGFEEFNTVNSIGVMYVSLDRWVTGNGGPCYKGFKVLKVDGAAKVTHKKGIIYLEMISSILSDL